MTDTSDRPAPRRQRLVYLTHPEVAIGKALCDSFLEHGFQFSMLPDVAALGSLVTLRRPDLVLMPLGDAPPEVDKTFDILSAVRGLHLGISAFLLAPRDVRAELVAAAVRRGASEVFSPPYSASDIVTVAVKVLGAVGSSEPGNAPQAIAAGLDALTYRERQVLQLIVEGRTNREIAAEFGLSYRTVEVHRRHVLGKAGARNTAELVRIALER